MKRLFASFFFVLLTVGMTFARLEGDGYYRIQNVGSGRYITIRDNRGSINVNTASADLGSVHLYKNFSNVVSDPSSILYIMDCGGGFKFYAQGTDTYEIIGHYLKVKSNKDSISYKAYQGNNYLVLYLGDVETNNDDLGVMGTNAKGTYRDWYVHPVKAAGDNYFGIQPTVQCQGVYYASFYASFPFNCVSSGLKVRYISKVDHGMAVYREVDAQNVPASMPILIQCASNNPSNNRVEIQANKGILAKDNYLAGVYFCNTSKAHYNVKAYDSATMRVLGVNAAGELVYQKTSVDFMPANQSYLLVPSGSPDEIKVVSEAEYQKAMENLEPEPDPEPDPEPEPEPDPEPDPNPDPVALDEVEAPEAIQSIYSLQGIKLGDSLEDLESLPQGLYIVNGKLVTIIP